METSDLIKKVRKIEIKTRGLSKNIFAGEYHSAFKGRGMTFSEVREYIYGDDIRNIDWNVTARFNHPYVKIYEEERELTVMLLIDVSGSREFGSGEQLKKNLITEVAAILAFSAIQNNDKIGVIFFSDQVEKFIPPRKGRQHILRIIREMIDFKPQSNQTNISEAVRYLSNVIKKRSIAFLISDMIDFNGDEPVPRFADGLKIANKKHDMVALRIYDQRERVLPDVGLVKVRDAETSHARWIDTTSRKVRKQYQQWWQKADDNMRDVFTKSGIDWASLKTDEDYVKPLMMLFKRR